MAGTRAQAPLRFRTRKLVPKQPLTVIREDEIQSEEYKELLEQGEIIATGVEQSEESEYHLQQALAALKGRKSKDAPKIVPAPPALESTAINFDEAYALRFPQPHSYIRFSSTVEECTGCQYDMNVEDDEWLKAYNARRPQPSQCSEDDFEKLMEYFEFTADIQAPFASVDNTVVSFDTMQASIAQDIDEKGRPHAKDVYEYWSARRQAESNKPLQPSLKFEIHQDADDSDPYVCFRRRDVRQTRKTRNRDVQSTEKLRKLRKELEDARLLVVLAQHYQSKRRDQISSDRKWFEQRAKVRDARLRLGIKHDDDDLILQRPQKRKAPQMDAAMARNVQLRQPMQTSGRPVESELVQLADVLREKENLLQTEIDLKLAGFQKWNKDYIDVTRDPLSEDRPLNVEPSFRTAHTQYLMTPPASTDGSQEETSSPSPQLEFAMARFSADEVSYTAQPSYRKRIGRSGRLWIDRRGMKSSSFENVSEDIVNRWKYDSDDDDEPPVYEVDPYDTRALKYRANIPILSSRPPPTPAVAQTLPPAQPISGQAGNPSVQAAPTLANKGYQPS